MPFERGKPGEVPDTIGASGNNLMSARAILVKTDHPQIVVADGRAVPIAKDSKLHVPVLCAFRFITLIHAT
jgi:hypothetical protein